MVLIVCLKYSNGLVFLVCSINQHNCYVQTKNQTNLLWFFTKQELEGEKYVKFIHFHFHFPICFSSVTYFQVDNLHSFTPVSDPPPPGPWPISVIRSSGPPARWGRLVSGLQIQDPSGIDTPGIAMKWWILGVKNKLK